ncbi:MAG: sugar ABC transporter ATP-binding protein, partial [Erysipelotrichaceae bacterium]|nr:sugar ABC transporter ATP-binding protein [Erysipelotrichaceae bacterium]
MENTILEFKNISKAFPGVQALKNVSFSVREGEVLALLGQNGAGKSTLVKCLTGALEPSDGIIKLFGKEYSMITPKQAKENGVGAVYQEQNLAENLPVVENIFMGNLPGNGFVVDYQEMLRRAQEIFDSFGVDIDPKASVAKLSPAKAQIVEIAKATAQNLKILILDEPTAPLTTKETETLFSIIRKLKAQGVSFIYISHRLEEIFEICDRCVVMRDGEYEGEKLVKDTNRQELIKMMIGRDLGNYIPERENISTDEVVLKVEHLTGNGDFDVSFELHKGEVLGFGGLVGAGRTELVEMLFNKVPHESGTIIVKGEPFTGKQPWDAIDKGIALLPEDRKRTGLFLRFPVGFNISLPSLKRFS